MASDSSERVVQLTDRYVDLGRAVVVGPKGEIELTTRETQLLAFLCRRAGQDVPRDEINPFERGPELSRGNRAARLWFTLRALGVDAIADAIREDLRLCRLAHDLLAEDERVTIVTEPRLSIFSFAVAGGEAAGRELVERVLADGALMLSSSRVAGQFVLRFCVANHRTTEADVRAAVARIRELI